MKTRFLLLIFALCTCQCNSKSASRQKEGTGGSAASHSQEKEEENSSYQRNREEEDAPVTPETVKEDRGIVGGVKSDDNVTNRLNTDLRRYDFCGDNHEHLTADEKATVVALKVFIEKQGPMQDCPTEVIQKLQEVKILNLANQKLRNFFPISGLTGLRELDISGNLVVNFEFLRNMPHLVKLSATNASVVDISALTANPKLEQLFLRDNLIERVDVVKVLSNLRQLDIQNNRLKSMLPFKGLNLQVYVAGNDPNLILEAAYEHVVAEEHGCSNFSDCMVTGYQRATGNGSSGEDRTTNQQ